MAETSFKDLKLYQGCEVIGDWDKMDSVLSELDSGDLPTLNGTKYVLTEFVPKFTEGIEEVRYCVNALLEAGYIPVIAHIERYADIY